MLKVIAAGKLCEDVELKSYSDGADKKYVANFTLACFERGKMIYKKCTAWGGAAEHIAKQGIKNTYLFCIGSEVEESYESRGFTQTKSTITVDYFEFGGIREKMVQQLTLPQEEEEN